MPKVADLHLHTNFSDGTFTPEKVVELAAQFRLSAISITDHDSCKAVERAKAAGGPLGIEVIAGVELTAEFGDEEIHIIGYFVDWQDKKFMDKLDEITAVRRERAKEILKKLNDHGVSLNEEELFKLSGPGSTGRLHIAQLLARKGYVSSVSDAFKRYIGNHGSCYVKKFKLSPAEASDLIHSVGGVSILAHPGFLKPQDGSLENTIASIVKGGIEGIEVYHTEHSKSVEEELSEIAKRRHLLITGGSDCHGFGKKEVLIGRVKIPYELVEVLKAQHKENNEKRRGL